MFRKYAKFRLSVETNPVDFTTILEQQYIIPIENCYRGRMVSFLRIETVYNAALADGLDPIKNRALLIEEYLLYESGEIICHSYLYNRDNTDKLNTQNTSDKFMSENDTVYTESYELSELYDKTEIDQVLRALKLQETKQRITKGLLYRSDDSTNEVRIYRKYELAEEDDFDIKENLFTNHYEELFQSEMIGAEWLYVEVSAHSTTYDGIDERFIRRTLKLLRIGRE